MTIPLCREIEGTISRMSGLSLRSDLKLLSCLLIDLLTDLLAFNPFLPLWSHLTVVMMHAKFRCQSTSILCNPNSSKFHFTPFTLHKGRDWVKSLCRLDDDNEGLRIIFNSTSNNCREFRIKRKEITLGIEIYRFLLLGKHDDALLWEISADLRLFVQRQVAAAASRR